MTTTVELSRADSLWINSLIVAYCTGGTLVLGWAALASFTGIFLVAIIEAVRE